MPLVILDDRLLIEELLSGLESRTPDDSLATTSYWHYRACRAAVSGAGGHLSGPFEGSTEQEQAQRIDELLRLRDDIALPDHRRVVPIMAHLSRRHPLLNLLNLEVAASGKAVGAEIWLSPPSASGVLPAVLGAEGVAWRTVELA